MKCPARRQGNEQVHADQFAAPHPGVPVEQDPPPPRCTLYSRRMSMPALTRAPPLSGAA